MKFKIEYIQKKDGDWVRVRFPNGTTWVPSFKEMCALIRAIGICEDKKYPNGKGRWMQIEMYEEALRDMDTPLGDLATSFDIPAR